MDSSPLLLVDIDGVIALWGFAADDQPPGLLCSIEGHPFFLSQGAGDRLVRLSKTFECAWCSGWEDRADDHLPHYLGVPKGIPHLAFDGKPGEGKRHWKLDAIDAYAGPDRPVAWLDDDHDDSCDRWASDRRGPTLLIRTFPATGLLDEHVERLEAWAMSHTVQ